MTAAPSLENISAQSIENITMTTSGRMESNVTLKVETLQITGTINGHSVETQAEMTKLYSLLSFIETLQLPKETVPAGLPPRGATHFIINYKDGHQCTLALNPNQEGLEYYKLEIDKFQQLHDLWMNL